MTMPNKLLASLLALVLLGTGGSFAEARGKDRTAEAIATLRAAFVAAYARGDAESVARFYAEDATYTGTAGDVVTGRSRLLIGLRREVPAFRDFRIEPAEFGSDGKLAYERGTYSATLTLPGRDPQPVSGPYLAVYGRAKGGGWLIKQHMTGRFRTP